MNRRVRGSFIEDLKLKREGEKPEYIFTDVL